MKKVLGTAIGLTFLLSVWLIGPVLAIAINVLLRPDYQMRDFATEYRARLRPNRTYWHDYRVYRMDCAEVGERRVVVLHTTEFEETPTDFLARAHPGCSDIEQLERDFWGRASSRSLVSGPAGLVVHDAAGSWQVATTPRPSYVRRAASPTSDRV